MLQCVERRDAAFGIVIQHAQDQIWKRTDADDQGGVYTIENAQQILSLTNQSDPKTAIFHFDLMNVYPTSQ